MREQILEQLHNSVVECDAPADTVALAQEAIEQHIDPIEIMDAVKRGLDLVGEKYERNDLFLMDLILAGTAASEVVRLMRPLLGGSPLIGKCVIGTVAGDMHDIGKSLVIATLSSAGFEIVDLGVDVSAEKFVEAVKKEKPNILGMSALLTVTLDAFRVTLDAVKAAGLRDSVKVMVGGNPVTPEYAKQICSDGYGKDAVEAARVARKLIGK
jgi:5-methyltetrahydrofolate--homocysteine methyltransferase